MAAVLRLAWFACCAALVFFMALAGAQVRAQDAPAFSQQELDQMLAPIALYPDALLSQVLMAATYPLEVVEAQRWAQANPTVTGINALAAVEQTNWDPSVKSLVAFPAVLQTMGSKLDWTERLGDAFLGQQAQVMDTVQALRHKAYAAGNLRSNAQEQVLVQGDAIRIVPVNPQVAYAPYYNPTMVYGPWWWSDYPPVFWEPWPPYLVGAGVVIGADFLFGSFDWDHHHVNVNYGLFHDRYFHHYVGGEGLWQHNPYHREGMQYRQPELRSRFAGPQAAVQARKDFRGFPPAASPVVPPAPALHLAPQPHVFENIGQGQSVRNFSNRGQSSLHPPAQQGGGGLCSAPGACGSAGAPLPRAPGAAHEPRQH